MIIQLPRHSHRLAPAVLLTLLALLTPWMPTPPSTAQQDNRQLKREQTQPKDAVPHRIALVIGNGAYQNVKPLKNPPNDANLLAATLRKLGFEVTLGTDKSQREMKQLIREFGQRLRGGGGVGLFYFAGHGVQARGHNYLIPVDAEIQTEADLEDVAVDVNYVLNMMDDAQNSLNVVILDACRNNPFARSFRSAQDGLAQVKAPTGTLIAYATSPDSVAADGGDANSPYAEELTKQIQVSGVLLETMFRRVAEQVSARSGGRQEPWYSANVKGDFFFSSSPANSSLPKAPATIDTVAVEREYWETIRSSSDPQDYKDYLQTYPNGAYAGVARAKIRQIEAAKAVRPTEPQQTNNLSSNIGTEAASVSTSTELGYWELIKGSLNPNDFLGYLRRYSQGKFVDLAKRRMETAQSISSQKARPANPLMKQNASSTFPNPVIVFAGVESRESGGKSIARYTYTVANWEEYPVELFAAAPNLPPCGMNTKAARTWVDLYDSSGKRIYGFCALDTLRGSGKLWFDQYVDVIPPRGIYIELTDRKTGKKYKSNVAETQ